MAVTDLTDSLPWWTRAGAGPTGTPAATPQGGGVGGQPPPGVDQQTWLNYLMQMFSPGSAQAGEPTPGIDYAPTGANTGTNDRDAALQIANQKLNQGLTGGVASTQGAASIPTAAPIAAAIQQQPPAPPQQAAGGAGGIGSDVRFPLTQQGPDYQVQQPDPRLLPAVNPNVPAAAAQPVSAQRPVPGPLATGGAGGVGATSNPRFVGIDRPNANPGIGGGMLGGARGGGPQMTALNLAGLFGGGGAAAAAPAAAPARAAGPMAKRTAPSGDNWDIDAQGNVVPNYGPLGNAPGNQQMSPDELASAVRKPNWWQSLGRPDMTPAQLASAVKKPNWYRNV